MLRFSLEHKILVGYIILVSVIFCMTLTILYEKHQIQKIESETFEIRTLRQNINTIHRYITKLSISGESVIDWDETDYRIYQINRLHTDSLLQAMKPYCINYVQPQQIDTLCILLINKEAHLRQIMDVLKRQEEADSLLINHLPEVAKRATRVRTVQQKKKGIAGFFGGKKTVQVVPSAQELHEFSDTLITLQRKQTAEMDAYADSLRTRNRTLNTQLNRLVSDLNIQAQTAFGQREQKIAEAQNTSARLYTVTISTAIILLFLSYLTIHRELKRNADEKRKREELIGELQVSNGRNKELIHFRRNLIQNVTHELRTPLTAISGNAELLLNDDNRNSRMRHAEVIRTSAGRMASMLNSLLDYFRLDSRKVTILSKPFKLNLIADTLETAFAMQAKSKHLTLTVRNHASEIVNGDKNRILSIGGNLLSNAIKFTDSGIITLTTRYKDGMFMLTVEDTGTGISEEQKERIFKPFERLGNAATQDGFGLGLSIVKRIVDMMHGKIRLESEKGRGSRFTVEVPMNTADGISDEEKYKPERRFERSFSVIVLDDNDILLSMVRDMYAHCGIRCDACDNTGDLMEAVRTRNYDLLITDLKMPETNGYEVLELLRSSDIGNSKTIPVIVATASGSCTEEELLVHGFTACLFKPFDMAELIDVSEK